MESTGRSQAERTGEQREDGEPRSAFQCLARAMASQVFVLLLNK